MTHAMEQTPQPAGLGRRLLIVLLVPGAMPVAAGCRSVQTDDGPAESKWDIGRAIGWKSDDMPPPPEIPARLDTTWTYAVKHTPGQTPKRGFGGRIMFFGPLNEEPVRVDGQLVVYAFDEDKRESYETQPTKRFIFPAEKFVHHESESKIGPSYSVWIPWDEVGGGQKNLSFITRFEPKGGPVVLGEQTRHLLPGVPQQFVQSKSPSSSQNERSIVLTGHSQESGDDRLTSAVSDSRQSLGNVSANDLNGTTILMPKSLKERLANSRQIRSGSVSESRLKRRAASSPTPRPLQRDLGSTSSDETQTEEADQESAGRSDAHMSLMRRGSAVDSTNTTAMSHRPSSLRSTDYSLLKRPAQ